jgi:outer membrane protein TolC
LADAEQRQSDALFELYRFTGPEVDAVSANGGELSVANAGNFDTTFSEDRLLSAAPEVQLARAQVAVSEKELVQAKAALRPVVNVTLTATEEITEGSLFGGGSDIITGEGGLSMNWSLYEGGSRRAKLREATKRIALAQLRVTQAEDMARRRLGSLKEAIRASRARESAIAAQAASAAQAYDEAKAQEDAGKAGAEVAMENSLRAELLKIDQTAARLRTLQLESELLGLFGALDTGGLSARLAG